jgi:hypothetical protein
VDIDGSQVLHIICESKEWSKMQWEHVNFLQPRESKTQIFAGNILDYCVTATRTFWGGQKIAYKLIFKPFKNIYTNHLYLWVSIQKQMWNHT